MSITKTKKETYSSIKLSTIYFSIGLAIALLNLLATSLMIFQFRVFHAAAEAQRSKQSAAIASIQTNMIDVDTLRLEYGDTNKKLQHMIDLAIETQERQAINEANIQTNHDYLAKVAKSLPTTKPIYIPDQVPLPERK